MSFLQNQLSRIESPLIRRIAGGAFWAIFGTATAKAFIMISGIICAHILGVSLYGELGLVRSTLNMFIIFGSVGMGVTATKYVAQNLKENKEKVEKICAVTTAFAIVTAVLVALIIFFLAPFIVDTAVRIDEVTTEIRIGTIILFATILNGAVNGILVGFEGFKNIAINTFISSIVESVLIIAFAELWGVMGALVGYGIGTFTLLLLNFRSAHGFYNKNGLQLSYLKLRVSDFKVLYKFSLPAALSSFLVTPSFWITRTMIVKYNGFEELGIYEAADQWKVIILFLPAALSQIVLPILSSNLSKDHRSDYWSALKVNMKLNGGITLIFSIIVSAISPWLIGLYGDGFTNFLPIIFLSFSTVFSSMATVLGMAIISREKVWYGLGFNLLWACMFTYGSYIALNLGFGVTGVSIVLMGSYMAHTIFQGSFLYINRKKLSE